MFLSYMLFTLMMYLAVDYSTARPTDDEHGSAVLQLDSMMVIDRNGSLISKPPGKRSQGRLADLFGLGTSSSDFTRSLKNETELPISYVGILNRYPDMTDKETIRSLVEMCSIAYTILPDETSSEDDPEEPFGQHDSLRGLVYSDRMNRVVVIAFKGTSPYILRWAQDQSSWQDQLNDNALFGCCHGDVNRQLNNMSCRVSSNVCDANCHQNHTRNYNNSYVKEADAIYHEIRRRFPFSSVWFTGHSLGGALASLMGAKYSRPVITFNAVGELFAGHRLGIKPFGRTPPSQKQWGAPFPDYSKIDETLPIYHFGNSLDPVYSGNAAFLKVFNYHLETKCHYGHICPLDPKTAAGNAFSTAAAQNFVEQASSIINSSPMLIKRIREEIIRLGFRPQLYLLYMYFHSLTAVIDNLARWDVVPTCKIAPSCMDCSGWSYGIF